MIKKDDIVLGADGEVGKNIKFDRIRRITGYLVGTVDRFNNAKRKELNDRVTHMGQNAGMPPQKI